MESNGAGLLQRKRSVSLVFPSAPLNESCLSQRCFGFLSAFERTDGLLSVDHPCCGRPLTAWTSWKRTHRSIHASKWDLRRREWRTQVRVKARRRRRSRRRSYGLSRSACMRSMVWWVWRRSLWLSMSANCASPPVVSGEDNRKRGKKSCSNLWFARSRGRKVRVPAKKKRSFSSRIPPWFTLSGAWISSLIIADWEFREVSEILMLHCYWLVFSEEAALKKKEEAILILLIYLWKEKGENAHHYFYLSNF